MSRLFGTDGVRGVANKELTCGMAFALGEMAVDLLGPRLVVGRDTRLSGPALESALASGIASRGGTALLAGIIPTPAVALLAREEQADGGVVISASHNPPEYNGIKFFDSAGFKLPQELEDVFEERLQRYVKEQSGGTEVLCVEPSGGTGSEEAGPIDDATPPQGAVHQLENASERYIQHAINTVRQQGADLYGLTIAVDTGFGASGLTTPEALSRLGASVVAINTAFDGSRINVGCGSTHLEQLKALVLETRADAGIAHDGDADRLLAVDSCGNEIDGDFIEAILALDLKARGKLPCNTVVSTVMCNLGFVNAMKQQGISVIRTAVGDSHVLEAMREGGYLIGGEQSGHLILMEHNSTGDGLITALQLLAVVKRSGRSLAELSCVMTRFPQVLLNVKVRDKSLLDASRAITEAVAGAGARLGDRGRVLLRPSGTELLIRVMVEAENEQTANDEAKSLAMLVEQELG